MNTQNPVRVRAKLVVSLSPGVHLRKLQKILGTSFSTTRYHVANLERDGEIVSSKEGRYRRLFPAGTPDGLKATYAALQNGTARKILSVLAHHETGSGDLSEAVDMPRSTVSENLTMLRNVGLVRRDITKEGRAVYGVEDSERTLELLAVFKKNLLNVAADRMIDLWDL